MQLEKRRTHLTITVSVKKSVIIKVWLNLIVFNHYLDRLTDVLTSYNPVLTCIGLGKRTEKDPSVTSLSSQQRRDSVPHDHSEEESVWSPLESPSQLSCHQPGHDRHELWECGSALSLPRTAEWDRFESLIQELDSRQSDLCLAQMARSITDLDLHQEYTVR